ncbi:MULTISPECIES: hypothetical protein [unclassified Knoellia]|uniref:hypothetical protein n=1 Tax=Knoellia altitudinis TaxID=3404795 RepID=UPI0036123CE1
MPSRSGAPGDVAGLIPTDEVRRLVATDVAQRTADSRTVLTGRLEVGRAPRALVGAQIRCRERGGDDLASTFTTTNSDPGSRTSLWVRWLAPEGSRPLDCGLYGHAALPPAVALQNLTVGRPTTQLSSRQVRSALELPLSEREVAPGTGTSLTSARVAVPAGSTRVEVLSGVQVSTFGDGDPRTPPTARGEVVTVIAGAAAPCTQSESWSTSASATPVQHHVKWHGTAEHPVDASRCPEITVSVGLRLQPQGPVLVEGQRYSSVLVLFS